MTVGQDFSRRRIVPAGHGNDAFQTFIEGTAEGRFIKIGRKDLILADHILKPQFHRTHMEGFGQFVDRCLQRKEALCRPIAAVSPGSNRIGIDTGITELKGFSGIIQRNRLMSRQGNRRRRMFTIRTGVP